MKDFSPQHTQPVSCVACLGNQISHLTTRGEYPIWKCADCGHGWVSPMPNEEHLDQFYSSEEGIHVQYDFPERSIRKHAQRLFRWIHQAKRPPGTLLDVGCGRGVHLEVARKLGWDVVGVDHSSRAREICLQRGMRIYPGLDSLERDFGQGAFDVITLWEVLEHSRDPHVFLVHLRGMLKDRGILALSTPNFCSVVARANLATWHELRPPMHLHYFTPASLEKLLGQCGLKTLNQLTYASYNKTVDRRIDGITHALRLPEPVPFLLKTAWYKAAKTYFDRTLQSKMQGLGLLCLSSPSEWTPLPEFRRHFFG